MSRLQDLANWELKYLECLSSCSTIYWRRKLPPQVDMRQCIQDCMSGYIVWKPMQFAMSDNSKFALCMAGCYAVCGALSAVFGAGLVTAPVSGIAAGAEVASVMACFGSCFPLCAKYLIKK